MTSAGQDGQLLPDREAISQFCTDIIRDAIQLVAINPETKRLQCRWFGSNAGDATEWAEQRNRAGVNIYWTANVAKEHLNRKPSKTDIISARFAHDDIDPPKDGSEWNLREALTKIESLEPSFVIASGNGLQPLWRLNEPSVDQPAVEAVNHSISSLTGGDNCWNIDRLLRLPGTVNYPNAQKRACGRVPALATLIVPEERSPTTLAALTQKFPSIARPVSVPSSPIPDAYDMLTVETLLPVPNPRLRQLINDPIGTDRSKDTLSCAIEMARWDYSESQIIGVLMNPANVVHAHVGDQANPGRAAGRAVAEAHKHRAEVVFSTSFILPAGATPLDRPPPCLHIPFPEMESPRPLRRVMSPATPFPLAALGDVLGPAARAIIDRVQCPDAMAAQAVLGVASLAVQGHANVILPPNGKPTPTSLFLVTVAGSGERKSAADSEALSPVNKRETALRQRYRTALPSYENAKAAVQSARATALRLARADPNKGREALDAIGMEPKPPLQPMLLVSEPTLEGLHKLYAIGEPSLGLFSDEGGQFVGGNGMNIDNRLKTSAGLSDLWDGKPIRRVRAVDGASIMAGRRLALHLMMQPDVAAQLLSDPVLRDQGLLSRLLVAAPISLAGTRFQRAPNAESEAAMYDYGVQLLAILQAPFRLVDGVLNELNPRALPLSSEAQQLWSQFADEIEGRLGSGRDLEPVRGFANKLPEHAVRLASVLVLVDNLVVETLSGDAMQRGILLAKFYAAEALRLFDASAVSLPIRKAEILLDWLHRTWKQPQIGLRQVYQLGPNAIRDAAKARQALEVLVEHGWLTPILGGATINGQRCREAWLIHDGS